MTPERLYELSLIRAAREKLWLDYEPTNEEKCALIESMPIDLFGEMLETIYYVSYRDFLA